MSRCMYRTRTEAEEVVEGMRARDLPLDVVHLDPLWLRGCAERVLDACDYEWDTDAFPDPPGFVRWLRERGVRLSLWENPYVPRDSPMFDEGKARRFFALAPDGEPAVSIHNPDGAVVDFTSPEAAAWIAAKHRPLLEMGVACFKTDYGESIPEDARFAGGVHRVLRRLLPEGSGSVCIAVSGLPTVRPSGKRIGGTSGISRDHFSGCQIMRL